MNPSDQARVLSECLPYLKSFHDRVVVVKYGGHAMTDPQLKASFARNVAMLKLVGIHPVVVHGGGPQIGGMLERLRIPSHFEGGLRVTDDDTMDVVEMVLVGSVNKDIVKLVNLAGIQAVGLSGKDGMLLQAKKKRAVVNRDNLPPEIIDIGNVGEVTQVNTRLLRSLIADGFVPVIAPVGVDEEGRTYNINADDAAGAVAGALGASRLLLLTDVTGVLDKDGRLLRSLTRSDIDSLRGDGTIRGGMIPKVDCCLNALEAGAEKATIIDGRVDNCLLLELLTDQGIGTQISSD